MGGDRQTPLPGHSLSASSAKATGGRRRLSGTTRSVSATRRAERPGTPRPFPAVSHAEALATLHFGERLRHSACKRLTNRACSGLARPCWTTSINRPESRATSAAPSIHRPGNTRER